MASGREIPFIRAMKADQQGDAIARWVIMLIVAIRRAEHGADVSAGSGRGNTAC